MPDLRGVAYCLLLMGANVLEFPIAMVLLAEHPWLFVVAVILRTVLLALVTVEFGLILLPSARGQKVLGLALTSVVVAVLLGGLPVAALAARDYSIERFEENAYRETIDYLSGQPQGGVIFTDQGLYQQLYGFLVRRHGMYLLEAHEDLPAILTRLAARYQTLYVVYAGSEDDQRSNPAMEKWLGEQDFPVSVEWLDKARVTRYSTPTSALEEHPVEATFADQMELTSCAFEPSPSAPAEVVYVSLSWRSLHSTEGNYTVFVHLIDESERAWAQHDGEPVGGSRPTSSWQPGEEITDHHGLALPADLPPGEYRLAVGLYDVATGERLPVVTGQGAAPTDRVLVGSVLIAPPTG
jgi:hypothetical protein